MSGDTAATRPLPRMQGPAPTSWQACDRCGAVVADAIVHDEWHDVVEGRVAVALANLREAQDHVGDVTERATGLEQRVTRLEESTDAAE